MSLAERAGSAVFWRGLSISAEKIIFLVRILILARLLDPQDFGLVAIGLASLAVMVSLTDFGIVPALVQQPSDDRRHLDTAWTIGVLRGAGINVVMFIVAPYVASAFGQPEATNIIRLLSLTTLLQAGASIRIAHLTRELQFRRLVFIRLSGAVANTAVSILLAKDLGAWAIVWGAIAGASAFMVVSYLIAPYRPRIRIQTAASLKLMAYGRWIFVMGVAGVTADALLRWVISHQLNVAELGLFYMAVRLAGLPNQVVTDLVSEVSFPVYAGLQNNKPKTAHAFRSLLVTTFAVLVPISAIFIAMIPEIVNTVLGEQWSGAALVMQILVIFNIGGVLGDTVAPLLKGTGHPREVAIYEIIQGAVLIPVAVILISVYGLPGAAGAALVSVLCAQVFAYRQAKKLIDEPFSGLGAAAPAIVAIAAVGGAASAGLLNNLSGIHALVFAGLFGTIAVVIAGLYLDRTFDLGLLRRMSQPFPALKRFADRVAPLKGSGGKHDDN